MKLAPGLTRPKRGFAMRVLLAPDHVTTDFGLADLDEQVAYFGVHAAQVGNAGSRRRLLALHLADIARPLAGCREWTDYLPT